MTIPERVENANWYPALSAAVARSPDPERASDLALKVASVALDQLGSDFDHAASSAPEKFEHILYALCGVAPFFVNILCRHPQIWLTLLAEDYERPLGSEELGARFESFDGECEEGDPGERLRQFKYRELARITVRDCCEAWLPLEHSGETLTELSSLADVLLARALDIASRNIEARFGSPRWPTLDGADKALGFCVLGLGKLGSRELNYSSDVDLIYVREAILPAQFGASDKPAPDAYFARLAQEFGKQVSAAQSEGFLYRVDLDLRPEGKQGPLVISDGALASYYETSADAWEKAAFMKARPVAGDLELGWRCIHSLSPLIFRSSMDFGAVRSIKWLKDRVTEEHGQQKQGFNVKIDAGGIRDIEFVAQAMQLLHGGGIPQLRHRGTQRALGELSAVGLLPDPQVRGLLDAYLFLRRIENRLQMEDERQTHLLPAEIEMRSRVARSMGFQGEDALGRFDGQLAVNQRVISEFFTSFLFDAGMERIFELFERQVPRLLSRPGVRSMIENLAETFAQQIDASLNPARALNNLARFIEEVGARTYYYELLLDRPELVSRLAGVFAISKFLSGYFASFPRLIEPVFANPDVLLLSREELWEDLAEIKQGVSERDGEDVELELEALRLFHHREILNIGVLEIDARIERPEAEESLTDVAEVCLEEALAFERHRAGDGVAGLGGGRFLIVAMGKLASREMSYGSDLDLIFLYDIESAEPTDLAEAQHGFARLSQRLISMMQMHTGEGRCYEVDTRLRPSGQQGTLVTSLAAFARYHEENAQVWERQALLRARSIAGDPETAESFLQIRRKLLLSELVEDPAGEISHVRSRMEKELAQETTGRRNFKTGRGGILDVESVVQYLSLTHCREHPELIDASRVDSRLVELETLGLLDAAPAQVLREGWDFLQRLSNRLRIVENRSISDLDAERGDLDGLARLLGYEASGRESGPRRRLLRDYQRHTEAIRCAYLEILGPDVEEN